MKRSPQQISMAAGRGKDPFNFDDIYRQAGVEDLFVKKSLADMKKNTPAAASAPPITTPATQQQTSTPVVHPGDFDDPMFQTQPVGKSDGGNTSNPSTPSIDTTSCPPSSDPFARLGLSPKPSHASSLAAGDKANHSASSPALHTFEIDDLGPVPQSSYTLDDMFGVGAPPVAPPTATSHAGSSNDPFDLFSSVEGAAAAVVQSSLSPTATAAPEVYAAREHGFDSGLLGVMPTFSEALVQSSSASAESPSLPTKAMDTAAPHSPRKPTPSPIIPTKLEDQDSVFHTAERCAEPRPYHPAGLASPPAYDKVQHGGEQLAEPKKTEQATSGLGKLSGFLRKGTDLGKKALKAAQAALESLDAPPDHGASHLSSEATQAGAHSTPPSYTSIETEPQTESTAADLLEVALQIADLPADQQRLKLQRLPPDQQDIVVKILEEQIGHLQQEEQPPVCVPTPAGPSVVSVDAAVDREPTTTTFVEPVVQVPHADFLGMDSPAARPAQADPAASPAAAAPPVVQNVDDMGDFFGGGGAVQANPAVPLKTQPVVPADVNDIGDFFGGGSASSQPQQARPAAPSDNLMSFNSTRPAASSTGDHMLLDLHVGNEAISQYKDLYQAHVGEDNEPEIRKQLRAAKLADKHAKMKAALAEKLEKDEIENNAREEQVRLKDEFKDKVDAWKNQYKGNIRGLLGSLQVVLWEDSGWKPVGVGDLLEHGQVKKVYMKANLLVHPDKVRQRQGTAEQVAIADMIFDVLKEAWSQFK